MELTFRISQSGEIIGLWNDMLADLPAKDVRVTRASEVEFEEALGGWTVEVVDPPCCLLAIFSRRADALAAERDFLHDRIRKGELN
jgi:hypothetical protein